MRVLTRAAVVAASVVALTATEASAAVYTPVTNPSFLQPYVDPVGADAFLRINLDSNAIPGWRVFKGNVDVYGRAAAKTTNGSQAVDLNGDTPGGIEQAIPTDPGADFRVFFRVRVNDHPFCVANAKGVLQQVRVGFAGAFVRTTIDVAAADDPGPFRNWAQVNVTLTALEPISRLQFSSDVPGACGALITDIRVVQA
ncbi:hypothetical protein [Kitasatospora sp. NPDC093558]|uniref:hypothetical protein n=1 Tax=Kitasatospora sp. NPDC093558 TaxID=3155201 RepID=UPI00343D592F